MDTEKQQFSVSEIWHEHKWEIIFGLIFAVVFGLAWEGLKIVVEKADRVEEDRLAAATVRVMTVVDLRSDEARRIAEEWKKDHNIIVTKDFAILQMASGFVVADSGWVVTAAHVVRPGSSAMELTAKLADKPYLLVAFPSHAGRLAAAVARDDAADTALVRAFDVPKDHYLVLGEATSVHRLDRIFAIGYPEYGDYFSVAEPTMVHGEISKIGRLEDERAEGTAGKGAAPQGPGGKNGPEIFQTTAPFAKGNSGGPLLDGELHVIGVCVATLPGGAPGATFARSIDRAREMLAAHHVELPAAYEHQYFLRPLYRRTAGLFLLLFLVAYFAIIFKPLWRRPRPAGRPAGHAGFWPRATSFLIDGAIVISLVVLVVVLLILVTGRYMPWYGGVLTILPLWWLYAAFCDSRWGATAGRKLAGLQVEAKNGAPLTLRAALLRGGRATVVRRARAALVLLVCSAAAIVLLLVVLLVHLAFLAERADDDARHVDLALWQGPAALDANTVTRLATRRADRIAWLTILPLASARREEYLYEQGLAFMLAGRPHEAIHAFERAAGDSWEVLHEPGNARSSVVDEAASKTGWCYFDLGDYTNAKKMFAYVLKNKARDRDSLLGMAVTSMRLNDDRGMRDAWARLLVYEKPALEELTRKGAHPSSPYYLTPSQLNAVHEVQSRIAKTLPPAAAQSPPAPRP